MPSIKLFFRFLSSSAQTFFTELSFYIGSYIAFLILSLLSCTPWQAMGYEQNSFYEIVSSIGVGILSLIVIVNVILIEKAKVKQTEKEELVYAAPTYLIYTLYSSLIIIAGLLCFVIPGIIAAILVGMVPLASVLIDNDSVNYFKISYRMARKDSLLVICFGLTTLLVELPSIGFDLVADWRFKLGAGVLYSFFDAALLLILTMTSVRVFYHLKEALRDPS